MSRRTVSLASAVVGIVGLTGSCSREPTRPPDETLALERTACAFGAGTKANRTVGREHPIGDDIPIDHFILVMFENRSFDHYFGTMPGVDGHPPNASNPDSLGNPVPVAHESAYCVRDPAHSWEAVHAQYNGGANDGFVTTNEPDGARAMGYYDERDLPFQRAVYSEFAMSDRHFCSVLTSTWTNRWYYTAATSFGRTSNVRFEDGYFDATFGTTPYNIFGLLRDAELEWRLYHSDAPWVVGGYPDDLLDIFFDFDGHFRPIADFYRDLEAGDMPPVTYIDPSFIAGVEQTDEHPPADPQFGQAFLAQLVDAVMHSPIWERTALIVTYDEHGGYYDHVPPPTACVPDDFPPLDADGQPREAGYDRLGFRVPLLVVSPFARRHYVSHTVTDHTSILRLIEARFGLPALTRRDANAWPMLDMFDFEHPDFSIPDLPAATIDEAKLADCHAEFD